MEIWRSEDKYLTIKQPLAREWLNLVVQKLTSDEGNKRIEIQLDDGENNIEIARYADDLALLVDELVSQLADIRAWMDKGGNDEV